MSEKQIVGRTITRSGLSGGGPGTLSIPGEPGAATPTYSGLQPSTHERDCDDVAAQQRVLLDAIANLHEENRGAIDRAMTAFYGPKGGTAYSGYAESLTSVENIGAIVDSNNTVGKQLIDIGLFVMGGWGGIAKFSKIGEAKVAAQYFSTAETIAAKYTTEAAQKAVVGLGPKLAKAADKLLGSGIQGAESAGDFWGKIALKVTEKVIDPTVGGKAGKQGTSLYKTIEKATGESPEKWIQGPFGLLESVIRGEALDAIGAWMKQGAIGGHLAEAQASYASFSAAAVSANVSAVAAEGLAEQLRELNKLARAKGCPEAVIPDWLFYTIDPSVFGAGAAGGVAGPTVTQHAMNSGETKTWDLFEGRGKAAPVPFW